ncbi:MAG: Flp pilus assembly protein CpaB [Betaproteobacteria bacterium HGW-Betaproteobacteria-22]|nr:MAG: Flp pilus assembly protein CpaB [Betaproteobacteria bacterium HGW-Betaproteobacteria-22]
MAQQNNTRIRQKRRQRTIIIVAALALLAIGAFFALSPAPKQARPQAQRPTGMIAVPVANRDITIGTRLSNAMFRTTYMPPASVPADALIAPSEFVGRFARRNILTNEHFREVDISEPGGHAGFSGVARPGMRIVHVNADLFPGALNTLRVGDRIDLLSIETSAGTQTGGTASAAEIRALQKQSSDGFGGINPGDAKSKVDARAKLRAATSGSVVAGGGNAVTATLIAENAEIMSVPRRRQGQRPDPNGEFVVMQMTPEDAHVTVLASSIGSQMRVVFRPFSDETRLTPVKEVKVTTRLPKPSRDPENIVIINGLQPRQAKAFSDRFRTDSENSQRFNPNADDLNFTKNKQPDSSNNANTGGNLNLYFDD